MSEAPTSRGPRGVRAHNPVHFSPWTFAAAVAVAVAEAVAMGVAVAVALPPTLICFSRDPCHQAPARL